MKEGRFTHHPCRRSDTTGDPHARLVQVVVR
jgi:hypothetical protein